jgi:DNA mismatch repair protein MutL
MAMFNMQVIKRLPTQLANQIAAGEVVQRPSSVVKELMENAIDAGATEISLSIKDGGRTLISIQDNGSGMNAEDALLCFERHATSKIDAIDDLFKLTTMGFRGEALASIGAVAHVSLKTKREEALTGVHIKMEGGNIAMNEEVVCSKGTLIEVKNLFYNVPARRNFLKSDAIEFNHIEDAFLYIAIAHPEVSFILHHNNQAIYNLSAANLKRRVTDVLGKNAGDRVFPIESETDIVRLTGFIGKPETAKKTRGNQFFFVNNRFFKSSYFNHAVLKAFEGLIPEKTHPTYFIFLEVDPAKIDVNIHPTKTEIKFEEERFIYSILLSTIRQSLGMFNLMPSLDFELETAFDLPAGFNKQPIVEPTIQVDPNFNPFNPQGGGGGKSNGFTKGIKEQGFGSTTPNEADWQSFYSINETPLPEQQELPGIADVQSVADLLLVGRYIFTPVKTGVMMIDSKRAMERILYDECIESFVKHPLNQQMLLFPIEKNLEKQELRIVSNHLKTFEQLGFNISLQEQVLHILGAPEILHENGVVQCIEELIDRVGYSEQHQEDVAHSLVLQMVKHAARYHRISNKSEAEMQIQRLFSSPDHTLSPSNEPIIQILAFEQLNQLIK